MRILPENTLFSKLPRTVRLRDRYLKLSAIVASFQDVVSRLRGNVGVLEGRCDIDVPYPLFFVTYDTGNSSVKSVVPSQGYTGNLYQNLSISDEQARTWVASALEIGEDSITSLSVGSDEQYQALHDHVSRGLSKTYQVPEYLESTHANALIASFYQRLSFKGTSEGFRLIGHCLGYSYVSYSPLWTRLSVHAPSNPSSESNSKDYRQTPDEFPTDENYDPSMVNDSSAFVDTDLDGLSLDPSNRNYWPRAINGKNPAIYLVYAGKVGISTFSGDETYQLSQIEEGDYILHGGSKGSAAYVDLSSFGTSTYGLRAISIAPGFDFNGMRLRVSAGTVSGTLRLRFTTQLSSVKYRSSYYDLCVGVDAEDAPTVNVQLNEDRLRAGESNAYPTLSDGTAVDYGIQLDWDALIEKSKVDLRIFDTLRPATRWLRRYLVGIVVGDNVGYDPYAGSWTVAVNAGTAVDAAWSGHPTGTVSLSYVRDGIEASLGLSLDGSSVEFAQDGISGSYNLDTGDLHVASDSNVSIIVRQQAGEGDVLEEGEDPRLAPTDTLEEAMVFSDAYLGACEFTGYGVGTDRSVYIGIDDSELVPVAIGPCSEASDLLALSGAASTPYLGTPKLGTVTYGRYGTGTSVPLTIYDGYACAGVPDSSGILCWYPLSEWDGQPLAPIELATGSRSRHMCKTVSSSQRHIHPWAGPVLLIDGFSLEGNPENLSVPAEYCVGAFIQPSAGASGTINLWGVLLSITGTGISIAGTSIGNFNSGVSIVASVSSGHVTRYRIYNVSTLEITEASLNSTLSEVTLRISGTSGVMLGQVRLWSGSSLHSTRASTWNEHAGDPSLVGDLNHPFYYQIAGSGTAYAVAAVPGMAWKTTTVVNPLLPGGSVDQAYYSRSGIYTVKAKPESWTFGNACHLEANADGEYFFGGATLPRAVYSAYNRETYAISVISNGQGTGTLNYRKVEYPVRLTPGVSMSSPAAASTSTDLSIMCTYQLRLGLSGSALFESMLAPRSEAISAGVPLRNTAGKFTWAGPGTLAAGDYVLSFIADLYQQDPTCHSLEFEVNFSGFTGEINVNPGSGSSLSFHIPEDVDHWYISLDWMNDRGNRSVVIRSLNVVGLNLEPYRWRSDGTLVLEEEAGTSVGTLNYSGGNANSHSAFKDGHGYYVSGQGNPDQSLWFDPVTVPDEDPVYHVENFTVNAEEA